MEGKASCPLVYGERVIGVVVLSKLGLDPFDEEDMRVLETRASHAAVAIENARLLRLERASAAKARAEIERALDAERDACRGRKPRSRSRPVLSAQARPRVRRLDHTRSQAG